MTTNHIPRPGRGQLNLNTLLLAVCVGLSGWALKSIDDLQKQVASILPVISSNGAAISGINAVNADQTSQLDKLANRVTRLETLESIKHKN